MTGSPFYDVAPATSKLLGASGSSGSSTAELRDLVRLRFLIASAAVKIRARVFFGRRSSSLASRIFRGQGAFFGRRSSSPVF